MSSSAKGMLLAAIIGSSAYLSFAAAKAAWNSPSGQDFATVGSNLANQRYSSLSQITSANISRLGGAWMGHTTGQSGGGSMEATPVVVKGAMYIPTGIGGVMAIDAATGAIRWKYESPNGGSTNRGVAVGEGKVFSSGGGNTLIALGQEAGGLVWTAKVGDRGTTVAPAVYYDGLVYMGVSGGETGARGHFGAFDARTGKEVWGFWSTPAPGERGSETRPDPFWTTTARPFWHPKALDPTG